MFVASLRRRSFLGGVATGLICGAAAAEAPRVAVFGDSLSDGLWAGLTQLCHQVSPVRLGRVSSGLVKTGFYDWPAQAARIAAGPYKAGFICIGLNDQQTIATDAGPRPFGTDGWDDAYAERVSALVKDFVSHQLPLVWVGLPRVREPRMADGVARINAIISREVPAAGGVYVATWDFTSGPHGFDSYLPDESGHAVNMRAADGVHFTPDGYRFLVKQVLARLPSDCKINDLMS